MASTINILANAMYEVLCASSDPARKEMRQACFNYMSLGGIYSSGLMSIFFSLNPCPWSLVFHFFALAIYGVLCLLRPFPSPKRLWIGARLMLVCIFYGVECFVSF